MRWQNYIAVFISTVGVLMIAGSTVEAQLPTIDEALELSKKSGAPIFAMAGRES